MKICLVYPNEMKLPKCFSLTTNILTDMIETLPPLGLLYIVSNTDKNIDIIDNRIKKYGFEKISKILLNYDIIGFGGTIFEIKEAKKLSRFLMDHGKITIYGGPNATVNWNLYTNSFSVIVRGEAELAFGDIINNINNLDKLEFTNKKACYVNLSPFKIPDLDKLKYPDRSIINLNDYRRHESEYLGGVFPIDVVVSSRGCPFDCYFCSSKVIWGKRYTYRSAENIIQEIKHLMKEYGTKGIYFREDNFTSNRKRLIDFCERVKGLNIVWMCESRADTLDESTIKHMAESGCKGIWFGIESTSNKVLKLIRKNITIERIKATLKLCRKYRITTGGAFMFGFPFDDDKSIRKNYKESKKLGLDICFYNRIFAIPKSEMHSQIINEGLDDYVFENIVLPATRYLSADELNKIYYSVVSWKLVFVRFITRIIGRGSINFLRKNLPFLYGWALKWLKK